MGLSPQVRRPTQGQGDQQQQHQQEHQQEQRQEEENERQLFVVPVSGTRGLHIRDVSVVFVLQPPRSMDEYLHMAGRTGRAGSTVPGKVVSLVNYDELARLRSWQTPLEITFEVEYET